MLNAWADFHGEIDLERLEKYGYVYAKAKIAPWSNLFNVKPYPSGYRKQLLSHLIKFYFDWKKKLDAKYDAYYLKIWVFYPRFIDSQVVAAIGNKIVYYNSVFIKSKKQVAFPVQKFMNEEDNILRFHWETYNDLDFFPESDYKESNMSQYTTSSDYYADQRFYRKMIKTNTPYNWIEDESGNRERLFYKQKGYIWVGEQAGD